MHADLEVTVTEHDNKWIAYNDDLRVTGFSWNELYDNLQQELLEQKKFPRGSEVTVFMASDSRIIPAWMRPYQSHYFNRFVNFEV